MDMNDDQLIRKFLQENCSMPEDNGFSERVMNHLPQRPVNTAWITLLEIAALAVGCVILLSQVDLTQVFCDFTVRALQFVTYLRYMDISINPLYMVAALTLLTVWGGYKIKEG